MTLLEHRPLAMAMAAAGYPVHEPKTLDNAYQRGKARLRAAA